MSGKKLKKAYEGVDQEKFYPLSEAIDLLKSVSTTTFDATIDLALQLNVDTRKSDQNVRGLVTLPHGSGKTTKVAVFAQGQAAENAKKAGADIVGAEDLLEKIQKNPIDFDRCIATPSMMTLVGRVGKILGPKGLMPNPKLGTVTENVTQAIISAKSGQIEFRTEKNGIIHAGVGKVSFPTPALVENIKTYIQAISQEKSSNIKGVYMKKAHLSSTMGPSIKLNLAELA